MNGVPEHQGRSELFEFLRGVGTRVRDHIPGEVVDVFREIAELKAQDSTPTVFLVSEEPHVPWELAVFENPPDPDRSPFLATQASVGRWILYPNRKVWPVDSVDSDPFRVVRANYPDPTNHLPGADSEAAALVRAYGASEVTARLDPVRRCLAGDPTTHLIHFALHGRHNPHSSDEGLLLEDGYLEPMIVRGMTLPTSPMVFLNACEVGAGNESLGAYAGTAEAFISAGACAVVAPLWAIDDSESKDVAIEFYRRTLAGDSPAEALREERQRFGPGDTSATRIAYQFFGHPHLKFT